MKIELNLLPEQAERLRVEAARLGVTPDRLLEALVGYLLELPAVDLGIFARHALRGAGESGGAYPTGAPPSDLVAEPPSPAYGASAEAAQHYVVDHEGRRTAVILPLAEHERLLEDLHDLAVVAERRHEKAIGLDEMKRRLRDDGLL